MQHILHAERITVDEIASELGFNLKVKLSEEDWDVIFKESLGRLDIALKDKAIVIIDATNLYRSFRNKLREIAEKRDARSCTIFVDTPRNIVMKRHNIPKERHAVQDEELEQPLAEMQPPTEDENVYMIRNEQDLTATIKKLEAVRRGKIRT